MPHLENQPHVHIRFGNVDVGAVVTDQCEPLAGTPSSISPARRRQQLASKTTFAALSSLALFGIATFLSRHGHTASTLLRVSSERWEEKYVSSDPDEKCAKIVNKDKKDCGGLGTNDHGCRQLGCCWEPVQMQMVPWCFRLHGNGSDEEPSKHAVPQDKSPSPPPHPTRAPGKPANCQSLSPLARKQCGFYGISDEKCIDQGCCWHELHKKGVPWCYQAPTTTTTTLDFCSAQSVSLGPNKAACGASSESPENCNAMGCCYSKEGNGPTCFVVNPPAATIEE